MVIQPSYAVIAKIDKIYESGNLLIRWRLNRLLRKIADLLYRIDASNLHGLTVGCGEGHMLFYLHQCRLFSSMVAVDINKQKLRHASIHHPVCKYLVSDVTSLNFKENSFDYILATELLEHLPRPDKAMEEICRVAKPRAYIILSVPYEPFFHWGNLLRGKYWDRRGRTPAHTNFWNRAEFKQFIGQFVTIQAELTSSTFPWLVFLGKLRCKIL